ncbi:tail fiber assembly protein [Lichenihabitans psoromatis]|uniref:tail fiber assembly protein n=1 Tax=Lichenihabitans psoromatis TaxID=2528642 RepID=UPI0010384E5C|nr:tail fiber assembly protein [Lichenihabitans psoromatis]
MGTILATKNNPAGWADLRAERDRRLAACDWTQMADAPLDAATRAAWVAHRQALRDMTAVDHIGRAVWPVQPAKA